MVSGQNTLDKGGVGESSGQMNLPSEQRDSVIVRWLSEKLARKITPTVLIYTTTPAANLRCFEGGTTKSDLIFVPEGANIGAATYVR